MSAEFNQNISICLTMSSLRILLGFAPMKYFSRYFRLKCCLTGTKSSRTALNKKPNFNTLSWNCPKLYVLFLSVHRGFLGYDCSNLILILGGFILNY